MTFDGVVGGVQCRLLLDTGSSINLMNKSVFDVLFNRPVLLKTSVVAKTAAQDPLPLLGRANVSLKLAGQVSVMPFYVTECIDVPVLLGLEFLSACPCVVDVAGGRLVMTPSRVVRSVSASVVSVGRVILQTDVSVPPGHELVVSGFVPNSDFRGPALMEPNADIEGVELVPSFVSVSGQFVPCIVRNISSEPVTIHKRSELGQLEVGVAECPLSGEGSCTRNWREQLDLSQSELTDEQRSAVLSLLDQYEDVVDGRLGFTSLVQHHIDTGNAPPTRCAARRIPPFLQGKVKAELDRMVETGILEENFGSSWGSPICVVSKKDGNIRICADLRKVNSVTRIPAYGIPRIDTLLDSLGGNSVFCVLDLKQCYYQIGVAPEDADKTTIVTPFGAYKHKRLPLGINGAPMTCARLLDLVLRDVPPETALAYFDDILIGGKDFNDVMVKLELVLKRLRGAGLTVNLQKCALFQKTVKFLGHVISAEGVAVDPEKVEKVRSWPVPRTAAQLASFLGMASYMRKHVRDFALIAAPLQRLLHKDKAFVWTEEAQSSFDKLRAALCEAPVLSVPDFHPDAGMFILETDASQESAGAVLKQCVGDDEKVIAYGSHRFSKAQSNYSVTKREMFAVVFFADKFSPYLLGRKFLVRTDHASLRWLMNFKNPTGVLARWYEILAQFQFTIEHRPGAEHVVPDALSRRPPDVSDESCQTDESSADVFRVTCSDWSVSYLRAEQDQDPNLSVVSRYLSAGRKPKKKEVSATVGRFLSQWHRLRLLNGVLYRVYRRRPFDTDQLQIVLPHSLVSSVLASLHAGPAGGHFASDKLYEQVRLRFWWPQMLSEIESFCRKCTHCGSRNKPVPAPRASLGELSATEPLDVVGLDILSSLPATPSGHHHLLVVVDHFSRWVEAYPLKTQEAAEVASVFVREFVSRFGCPRRIHSDRGANFTGEIMRRTCELLGISRSTTTAFHPMSNSIVERTNRTLINMFAKFLEQHEHAEWDKNLPLLLLGLRGQVHRSLGVSPYCVLFGREPRLPVQVELDVPLRGRTRGISEYLDELRSNLKGLHRVALENSRLSHQKNKAIYDRKVNDFNFAPGDAVYLHKGVVPKGAYYKFLRPWKPAVIVDKVGDLNYRVRLEGAKSTLLVHHNRLKPRVGQDSESGVVCPAETRADDSSRVGCGGGDSAGTGGRFRWNGRSDEPAGPITESPASRAPIISSLSPFALCFTPIVPLTRSEPDDGAGSAARGADDGAGSAARGADDGAGSAAHGADDGASSAVREADSASLVVREPDGLSSAVQGDSNLRRSGRTNKGVPPQRLGFDVP